MGSGCRWRPPSCRHSDGSIFRLFLLLRTAIWVVAKHSRALPLLLPLLLQLRHRPQLRKPNPLAPPLFTARPPLHHCSRNGRLVVFSETKKRRETL